MSTTLSEFVTADTFKPLTRTLEEVWTIQEKITDLEKKIARLEAERDGIIEEHIAAGVMEEGPLFVKKDIKRRSTPNAAKFAAKYPKKFDKLVKDFAASKYKPTQKEALTVITSYQLEQVSDVSETVSYSVDLDIHKGAEL